MPKQESFIVPPELTGDPKAGRYIALQAMVAACRLRGNLRPMPQDCRELAPEVGAALLEGYQMTNGWNRPGSIAYSEAGPHWDEDGSDTATRLPDSHFYDGMMAVRTLGLPGSPESDGMAASGQDEEPQAVKLTNKFIAMVRSNLSAPAITSQDNI